MGIETGRGILEGGERWVRRKIAGSNRGQHSSGPSPVPRRGWRRLGMLSKHTQWSRQRHWQLEQLQGAQAGTVVASGQYRKGSTRASAELSLELEQPCVELNHWLAG